jgi:aconitase B
MSTTRQEATMRGATGLVIGLAMVPLFWGSSALAQGKPACTAQGKVSTPQKVDGEVVKVDAGLDKVTVRGKDGAVHEFQVSKETLRDLKAGDHIEATLREAPKCP